MQFLYSFKNQLKISASLLGLSLILLLTILYEKHNLKSVNQCFSSIFADRLVPATDINYLTNQYYVRRLSVLELVNGTPAAKDLTDLQYKLRQISATTDSLEAKYKATYLVESEKAGLSQFVKYQQEYLLLEQEALNLLDRQPQLARQLLHVEGGRVFKQMMNELNQLTTIQSNVGKQLMVSSQASLVSADSVLNLQSIVVILLLIGSNGLIFLARLLKPRFPQKFNLN